MPAVPSSSPKPSQETEDRPPRHGDLQGKAPGFLAGARVCVCARVCANTAWLSGKLSIIPNSGCCTEILNPMSIPTPQGDGERCLESQQGRNPPKLPSTQFLKAPQTLPGKPFSGLNLAWMWHDLGGNSSWAETEKPKNISKCQQLRCGRAHGDLAPRSRGVVEVLSHSLAKLERLRFLPCLASPGHTKSSISWRGPQSISAFKASNKTLKLCRQHLALCSKGGV